MSGSELRIVVVGNGMAGARVAAELRARRPDAAVTVLGAEPFPAYNRIMLSAVLAGAVTENDIQLADGARHGVQVRVGVTVTAVDRAARRLRTDTGEHIPYDRLILATGSRAVVPPLAGLEPAGDLPETVATFRTLADCRRILAAAGTTKDAIVLGGGLLGLEAARGLAAQDIDVHLVHAVGHLMERQLDAGASAVLVRTLRRLGVTTYLSAAATSVRFAVDGVTLGLADGVEVTAGLLVLACGVRPDTVLARAAGLPVDRGIVVDDQLRTSDPDVFAIGDCAQHRGVTSGLVAPAWEQARVVAQVIAGETAARYRPLPMVTRLKAEGIDLAAMGDPEPDGWTAAGRPETDVEELSFTDPSRGTYARLVIVDDRIQSAIMLGDNPAVGTVIQLFDRGAPVPADRRSLLLGRSTGSAGMTADSPALMPDSATVCQCNSVRKGDLVRCWRAGANNLDAVIATTRATTGCGTCRGAVEGIIGWLATVEPREGVAA